MFFLFFSVVFAISLLRSVFFWLSYVQRKQYRADRIWAAIQQPVFWKLVASPYRIALCILFVVWQISVRWAQSGRFFDLITLVAALVFFTQSVLTLRHLWRGTLELPAWTKKIGVLAATVAVINIFALRWPWGDTPYAWSWHIISPEHALGLELIQPFLVFAVFFILVLPNIALQRRQIVKASRKRKSLTNLSVIGITGSVGKTTMKEFVSHLLAANGKTLKTPTHINVDTGVARQVLEELDGSYRWYVVEMGAYRPGEIKSICDMVKPEYGILTALTNQHVELFGSRERLRDAKFELVDSVGSGKNLFMNADSESLRLAARQKAVEPHWYGLHESAELHPQQITFTQANISFSMNDVSFTVPGFGSARLSNAVGAITFCHALGMDLKSLSESAKTLPILDQTMEVRAGKEGSMVIDSSYNASTEGVIQAIKDLALITPEHKVVVFKEVIELGDESEKDHLRIADALAESKASVLLLPSAWKQSIEARLLNRGADRSRILQSLPEVTSNTAVLLLGRDAQPYLNKLV